MSNNDKYLKDMWNKAENLLGRSEYERSTIEQFMSKRSNSTAQKIKNVIFLDIFLKFVLILVLGIDMVLYLGTNRVIAICITGMVLLGVLLFFEFRMLNRFSEVADYGKSTREKLAAMLTYLRSGFYSTLIAISVSYPFVFVSGSLLYFYVTYGQVRPLDGQDILVFSVFILTGLVFNFYINKKQVDYQVKHLENCLSDLNDSSLETVSRNLEKQRKQDISNKVLLFLVLALGFTLLMILLKTVA